MDRRSVAAPHRPLLLVAILIVLAVVAGAVALAVAPVVRGPSEARSSVPEAVYSMPARPRLLILGDSYTEGYAASPPSKGYAVLVGESLGWPTDVDGVGGTGFTYGGPGGGDDDYVTRIERYVASSRFDPNVIVLEGSQNDYRSVGAITGRVVTAVKTLRAAYPEARIVLFGPAAPEPLMSQLGPIDRADRAAADELRIPYISPYQGQWFTTDNTATYGFEDGAHLNTAGHAYLAKRFLDEFRPLFGL